MIPIRELLNRIRWDPEYGQGDFAIGYYDRLEERIIVVPFGEVAFAPDDHFAIQVTDALGQTHNVPLHRVCEVYRNGERIWQREHR
jgi:uncharacterized protein (UPF0248 family)